MAEWTASQGGVWWDGEGLALIEQTLLPAEYRVVRPRTLNEVADAIYRLAVRGAPAIGIAAAYGLAVALDDAAPSSESDARRLLHEAAETLRRTRPTAVNLAWAVERVLTEAVVHEHGSVASLRASVFGAAEEIAREDRELCRRIGLAGVEALQSARHILTHCNAGALATGGYGTATAPLYLLHERGEAVTVLADETRPLLQGSRLTAWELKRAGIPVRVTADGASGALMSRGLVDAVIVGADRIAENGDTANKIGTFNLALAAAYHGIPFYVAAPFSTFDPKTPDGAHIPIEERPPEEVLSFAGRRVAPEGVTSLNLAFDVTPHELVTAFLTDQGVLRPPYRDAIAALSRQGVS